MAVGSIVKYAITETDAEAIYLRWTIRGQGFGQYPKAGDLLPAVVVKDNGATVNVHVFLDGSASYWAKDVNTSALVAV